jgi:hypothetical protein
MARARRRGRESVRVLSESPPNKERWQYSAYTASPDHEQAAAAAYELAVAWPEHWLARGRP